MSFAAKLRRLREYRYELIAVMNGFIIMVLEIVGARMVAPYFGTSIYVWTAVIGVILGALSFGYWYGGKLADRSAGDRQLSRILILAALIMLITLYVKDPLLQAVADGSTDLRLGALVASILLFAPANVLMGMVSPYLAKLKLTSLETAGSSVGGLYAAGTLGSIMGTFAAGYWLISWMGNRALGLWLILGLILASVVVSRRGNLWERGAVAGLALFLLISGSQLAETSSRRVVFDGDTAYSRYQVVDEGGDEPRRLLLTDNQSAQSGIYLNNPGKPAFEYINRFVKASEVGDKPKKVLLIGGGAFTLPPLLLERHPESQIDVVEIDPFLSELAEKYFAYKPDSRTQIFNEDGRTFINRAQDKYDLIYVDAFTAISPPFQLTTTEAVKLLSQRLTPDGAVVVNVLSTLNGPQSQFGRAEVATYQKNFGFVAVGGELPFSQSTLQNVLLVAGAPGSRAEQIATSMKLSEGLLPGGTVLTDDFAPVEQMTAP